jgi:hypothetical protein
MTFLTYTSNVICSRQKLKFLQSVECVCLSRSMMLLVLLSQQPYALTDTLYDHCEGMAGFR